MPRLLTLLLVHVLIAASTALNAGAAPDPSSPVAKHREPEFQEDEVKDRTLQRVWRRLKKDDKREVVQWFLAEVEYLRTFQNGLLQYVIARQERSPREWPVYTEEEIPLFDPAKHAPAQPIERKLKESSSNRRFRERVLKKREERKFESEWVYDYTTGMPTRVHDLEDLDRVFENGVLGIHPQLGYAEVLVEQMLDDGKLRTTHQAFAHGYADREGMVVPGVTLYDVWASGVDMEMPDVECLGIIHMVEDDWRSYRAPVPPSQHKSLYGKLGDHFAAIHRQKSLNQALARVYLNSDPALATGWEGYTDQFHALWDQVSSKPEELAQRLPQSKDWTEWLNKSAKEIEGSEELWAQGQSRKATLTNDRQAVRNTLIYVMREYGVLPKPKPKKKRGK